MAFPDATYSPSCDASTDRPQSSSAYRGSNETTNGSGIDQGFATNDAAGDARSDRAKMVGQYALDVGECKVTIHNSSDGASDHYIGAQALLGSTVIVGLINTLASPVPGGGTAEAKLSGLVDGQWDSVRIITVQRTAS